MPTGSGGASYTTSNGRYSGWDKFGRLALNSWVTSDYKAGGPLGIPAVWQERYTHDLGGRRLAREDTAGVAAVGVLHHQLAADPRGGN